MKIWLFAFSHVQSIMHFFMPRGNKSNIKAEKRKNHFVIFFSVRERAVFYKSCNMIGSESMQYSPHPARSQRVTFFSQPFVRF